MALPNDLKFCDSDDQNFSICDNTVSCGIKKAETCSMTSGLFQ